MQPDDLEDGPKQLVTTRSAWSRFLSRFKSPATRALEEAMDEGYDRATDDALYLARDLGVDAVFAVRRAFDDLSERYSAGGLSDWGPGDADDWGSADVGDWGGGWDSSDAGDSGDSGGDSGD